MFILRILSLFLLIGSFIACNNNSVETPPPPPLPAIEQQPTVPVNNLPTLSQAIIQKLLTDCDYIDYVFYELGFSVNINSKANVATSLQQIGNTGPEYLNCTQSIGRVSFLSNGDVITEAEVYYTPGYCTYFVFYEDKQPAYATLITEAGAIFFNNLMNRNKGNK